MRKGREITMTYYRVKPQHDNFRLIRDHKYHGILIANELYTGKELVKKNILLCYRVEPDFFEKVEISRKKIYWFFGARFAQWGRE